MANVSFKSKSSGGAASVNMGGAQFRTWGNPIPYVAPWFVGVMGLILSVPLWFLSKDVYGWYWSPLVFAAGVLLTVGAWRTSRARGPVVNTIATAATGAACAWLWYVAGIPRGELTWRPYVLYLIGMIVVCLVSNMFCAWREGTPGGGVADAFRGGLEKLRAANEIGIDAESGELTARIEVEPPHTIESTQKDLAPALASVLDLPSNGVTVTPRRGESVRVGDVRLSPVDRLAVPPRWPGPSRRLGEATLLDPLILGNRRSHPLQLWLPGDKSAGRNASLLSFTGMSGAGKSWAIRLLLIEAMTRGQFEYWYLNSRKADQEPDWVLEGASRVETTRKGVIAAMREWRDSLPEQGKILGRAGFEQWAPGAPKPFRLIVADEAGDWAKDVERILSDVAETARSLGDLPLFGLQRASHDRFPTSARSNIGTQMCFGVRDEEDAGMALPDDVLDAGAKPWLWQNREPGRCYLAAPGVPVELWPQDARTFDARGDAEQRMERWAKYLIHERAKSSGKGRVVLPSAQVPPSRVDSDDDADPLVAEFGDVLSAGPPDDPRDEIDLRDYDDDSAVESEVRQAWRDEERDDPDYVPDDDDVLLRPAIPADCREILNGLGPDDGSGARPSGNMRIKPEPKMRDGEARVYLRSYLNRLGMGGAHGFKIEDIAEEIIEATGFGASWIRKWTSRWSTEGAPGAFLRKTDERGWYEFGQPAIERGDDD